MIELTVVYRDQEIDLAIPNRITIERLEELLRGLFSENKVMLPQKIRFNWMDKNFQLGKQDFLADFRIANGDRVEITVEEVENA